MFGCMIINGKEKAQNLLSGLKDKIQELNEKFDVRPCLAVILIGDDHASRIYVGNKVHKAKQVGIKVVEYYLGSDTLQSELEHIITSLNQDVKVHGILVQLPLPKHINTNTILELIDYKKDVDGFHIRNVGKLYLGLECLEPCTARGILLLIKSALGDNLAGKKAVVLGRSRIVGRPTASMLLKENCTVTILHSYSKEPQLECQRADILISAIGIPEFIDKSWVKPGACVIDVGINRINGKLVGDIEYNSVKDVAGYLTPVPGGVGPMTVACVLENTVKAAGQTAGIIAK